MSFLDDVKLDVSTVLFNTMELGRTGTINPANLLPRQATIIRGEMSQFISADPGQGDADTFLIQKADYPQPLPNDKITLEGVDYYVQPGFTYNGNTQVWTVPVVSNGRVKA